MFEPRAEGALARERCPGRKQTRAARMERALHFCLPPPRCGISDGEQDNKIEMEFDVSTCICFSFLRLIPSISSICDHKDCDVLGT